MGLGKKQEGKKLKKIGTGTKFYVKVGICEIPFQWVR